MFTVFGANGNTGSVVARRLIEAGKNVRLVVRNPDKVAALRSSGAEVVKGDVTDAGTVEPALAGAEGAYLLVPPDNKSNDLVGRGRSAVSRAHREGASRAARGDRPDPDAVGFHGERRRSLSRDDRRIRCRPRVRGQGPGGARKGCPRRRTARRSRLTRAPTACRPLPTDTIARGRALRVQTSSSRLATIHLVEDWPS